MPLFVVSVFKMILVVEHEVQTCIPLSGHLLVYEDFMTERDRENVEKIFTTEYF